jgi:hypothetical protein
MKHRGKRGKSEAKAGVGNGPIEWARACLLVQRLAIRRGDSGLAFFAGCVGWGCFFDRTKGAR